RMGVRFCNSGPRALLAPLVCERLCCLRQGNAGAVGSAQTPGGGRTLSFRAQSDVSCGAAAAAGLEPRGWFSFIGRVRSAAGHRVSSSGSIIRRTTAAAAIRSRVDGLFSIRETMASPHSATGDHLTSLGEMLQDQDAEKSQSVMKAMMQMDKI